MALLFYSTVDSAALARLEQLSSEIEVRIWPEIGDRAEIDYALLWRPPPGLLASLPNLKLILSLAPGSTMSSAIRCCRGPSRSSASSIPT
jgi:glyoxylate/hydroxypyruvate reductase A